MAQLMTVFSTKGISVGAVDVMTCDQVPENSPKILGIYARIYYPIDANDIKDQKNIQGIIDHEDEYTEGVARVAASLPVVGKLLKALGKSKQKQWNKKAVWPVLMNGSKFLPGGDGKRPIVILNPGYTGRSKELLQTVDFVVNLNNGSLNGDQLHVGADFDWHQFKGQLDINNIIAIGHSQGVPVILEALQQSSAESPSGKIKCAIEMDGTFKWHKKDDMEPLWRIKTPVLYLKATKELVPKTFERHLHTINKNPQHMQMGVLNGSTHTTFCDARLLPKWLGGSKIDHVLAEELIAKLTLELLNEVKKSGDAFTMESFPPKQFMDQFKGVLAVPVTDEIERKLDKNFIPFDK